MLLQAKAAKKIASLSYMGAQTWEHIRVALDEISSSRDWVRWKQQGLIDFVWRCTFDLMQPPQPGLPMFLVNKVEISA